MATPVDFTKMTRRGKIVPAVATFADLSVSNATQYKALDPTKPAIVLVSGTAANIAVSVTNSIEYADLENAAVPWASIATAVGRVELCAGYTGFKVGSSSTTGTLKVTVLQPGDDDC